MADRPEQVSSAGSSGRKFTWLAGAILAGCLIWTGGWAYAARSLQSQIDRVVEHAAASGYVARCANSDTRGFPFRLGLFCDRTEIRLPARKIDVKAAAFRSAAQIYRPGHVVSELDGPLSITGQNGLSAQVDWQLLHASTFFATHGLDRVSVEGTGLSLNADGSDLPFRISASASRSAIHLRQNGRDLDIAATAERFAGQFARDVSAQSIGLQITIPGRAFMLSDAAAPLDWHGMTVLLHNADFVLEQGVGLSLSGQINIGPDGLLSGDLRLRLDGYERLVGIVARTTPDLAEHARQLAPVLAALDTVPSDEAITLPLTLHKGELSIGFLTLGRLPAI